MWSWIYYGLCFWGWGKSWFLPLLCFIPPTEGFPWDDLCKNFTWMSSDSHRTKCRRNIAENFNRLSRVHQRYGQTTDRRQTNGRRHIAKFTFAKNWWTFTQLSTKNKSAALFSWPTLYYCSTISTCLFGWKNGHVFVVNLLHFVANTFRVLLLAKVFAREPEQQILFAEFGAQKLSEQPASSCNSEYRLRRFTYRTRVNQIRLYQPNSTQISTRSSANAEIARIWSHCVFQDHSGSLILIAVVSSYATI